MKRYTLFLGALLLLGNIAVGQNIQDLTLFTPDGWKLHQGASADGARIYGFENGNDYVTFYVRKAGYLPMKTIFVNGSQLVEDVKQEAAGPFNWDVLSTTKTTAERGAVFVKAFQTEFRGNLYYGYSRSSSATQAADNAKLFMNNVSVPLRSLTDENFSGRKYYFGWGAAGFGDPSMMQNEVKYDVKHTHDVFTKDTGGGYTGVQQIGAASVNGTSIRNEWKRLKSLMTQDDMYIQYSSGHGSQSGLGVGVSYSEMRDTALSLPAKEIVIFTMACYSGNLVEAFNAKKAEWKDWQSKGRTLMVMSSSLKSETSSTGPGTDPGESGGPNGSAGSAFGHALWKALSGQADGYTDGVKDGFLSLGEIRDFTINKTKQVGGHTPASTGAYNTSLIMNKVPSREFLASLEGGTDGLSDDEIMTRIQELDRSMRIQ